MEDGVQAGEEGDGGGEDHFEGDAPQQQRVRCQADLSEGCSLGAGGESGTDLAGDDPRKVMVVACW